MIRGVIGSVVTMVSYDLTVIVNLPGMDEWKFLETASIFKMLSPCEIVTRGHTFAFNTSPLFVLAMTSILFVLAVSTQRDLPKDSPLKKSWPSVKAMGYAIRITQDGKGNESFENRNILISRDLPVSTFASAVRNHWSIEAMHWTPDVTFREDSQQISERTMVNNLS